MTLQYLPNRPPGPTCQPATGGKSIVNRTLTRIAEYPDHQRGQWLCGFCGPQCTQDEARMQRLRLKADGRIVELRDGQEFPLAPVVDAASPLASAVAVSIASEPAEEGTQPAVRDLRRRACLTQMEFANR